MERTLKAEQAEYEMEGIEVNVLMFSSHLISYPVSKRHLPDKYCFNEDFS